jgi:hypothetical protein
MIKKLTLIALIGGAFAASEAEQRAAAHAKALAKFRAA